jgi:hypothetical protein
LHAASLSEAHLDQVRAAMQRADRQANNDAGMTTRDARRVRS